MTNLNEIPESITSISSGTQGYDLNCYIKGFLEGILHGKMKFIFFNNSLFISNPVIFTKTLLLLDKELDHVNFTGFSISEEVRKHFQSFLFGINLTRDAYALQIIKDTCIKFDRAFTRDEVINLFELRSYVYVVDHLKWNYSVLFKPGFYLKLKGYLTFLLHLGFLDNIPGLLRFERINFSIFLKRDIERKFGFRKIKSTSIINKWNES
ncbi:MAG: hypothetical protein ABJH98_01205 [Reichenbachiella sp.]|uniref:hypothetical protein n=1 Tax=Reichenbachiella sp. TaxID=2184521 RepID=UPI00329A3AA5